MAQTPQQRRANEKYAKSEAQKMGAYKPPKLDKEARRNMEITQKSRGPGLSRWVAYGLIVILLGGGAFELVRLIVSWIF